MSSVTFKGLLVSDDKKYKKYKRRQSWYFILFSILIGSSIHFGSLPTIWTILLIGVMLMIFILDIKIQRKTNSHIKSKIELDPDKIVLRDENNAVVESIMLNKDYTLQLNEKYSLLYESDLKNEIKGDNKTNLIKIAIGGKVRRFDFIIPSHYMLSQLTKVVEAWKKNDFQVDMLQD